MICVKSIKFDWAAGWKSKSRLSGTKTRTSRSKALDCGGTMVNLVVRSFLLKNCLLCLALIGTMTSQFFISIFFFLISMTKFFGDIMSFPINKFALRP